MTDDQEGFGVYLRYAVSGGVVAKSELALKIAELLLAYIRHPFECLLLRIDILH